VDGVSSFIPSIPKRIKIRVFSTLNLVSNNISFKLFLYMGFFLLFLAFQMLLISLTKNDVKEKIKSTIGEKIENLLRFFQTFNRNKVEMKLRTGNPKFTEKTSQKFLELYSVPMR
jgi:hypothetical protein